MTEKYEIVSVEGGKFHRPLDPEFERNSSVLRTPRAMLCGRSLVPHNFFVTAEDANRYTGGRLEKYRCTQCEKAVNPSNSGHSIRGD